MFIHYYPFQIQILAEQMGANLQSNKKLKIHFVMQKQLEFGKAIYVVGNIPELGSWSVKKSLKLSWFKDHYWTGFVQLTPSLLEHPIQYKYAIANWDRPQFNHVQWEAGKRNRLIQGSFNSQHIICQNNWNMEKITFNLIVPDEGKNEEYSVIGDCKQLGAWKKRFKMKRNDKKNLLQLQNLKQLNDGKKYTIFTYTFEIFRGKPKIHYYYIKRGSSCEVERQPGRKYQLELNSNSHPKCLKISHQKGDTQMFQICNFKQLNYSKVTQNILLGPYLRTPQDFKVLKDQGVSSILSIQTGQDLAMHCLTEDYLSQQSVLHNIKLHTYAIQDMNKKDFCQKCTGAVQLLKKLVKDGQKVYVHCSAGVYRSPQIVVLFLILTQNYSPLQAVEYVKSRHPFARPNRQVLHHALQILSRQKQLESQNFQS